MKGTKVADASMRVRTEELQECVKEEAWQRPKESMDSDSSSGGLGGDSSSESSSDEAVHPSSPSHHTPALPNVSQDRLVVSRSPSKNSAAEVNKIVEGLTSFRAALLTNQRLTLQMLDREMEKVKQLPNMVAEGKVERREKSKEVRVRLPGALGPETNDNFGEGRNLSKEVKQALTPAPFAHLQTLDQKRKRRMSWIPKTGSLPGTSSTDFETQLAQLPNVPQSEHPPELPFKMSTNSRRSSRDTEPESPESLVVAHLTKAEKAQAKREAEAFQEAGMRPGCMRGFLHDGMRSGRWMWGKNKLKQTGGKRTLNPEP